jgi:hypothetical protein
MSCSCSTVQNGVEAVCEAATGLEALWDSYERQEGRWKNKQVSLRLC